MKEFVITQNEENKRLDKFLKTVLPKAPDSFIYKMLRKKNIKLNSSKADGTEKLNIGDKVCIYFSDDTFDLFHGNSDKVSEYERAYSKFKNIIIVYEDDDVIIMNKPENILSQKADMNDLSLNEWMIGYLLNTNKISEENLVTFKPSVLNRLDRNTKGLVIGAKSLNGSRVVSKMIKDRTIKKFYRAKVYGIISQEERLKGYLSKDKKNNIVKVYKYKPDNQDSDYIETRFYPIKAENDNTLLEIELITGKSHQIRAHLASIGHPILGDNKYGNQALNKKLKLSSQELYAVRLEFPEECEIDSLKGRIITL